MTKNDHFRAMRHASLGDIKFIRSLSRLWLTRLDCSRYINQDKTGNRPVKEALLSEQRDIVHLKGCGMIKVFKKVRTDDDFESWATNDLKMTELMRLKYAGISWMVISSRGQQLFGIERCQVRSEQAQRNHIEMALRAFLRIEYHSSSKEFPGLRPKFPSLGMLSEHIWRSLFIPSNQ
ncbi:MAG: hypothetical protein ACL93V_01655 [Candidatus Electrothrix sp. YB6]